MGHHGIKILCGFSFYGTEYFRGVGGCAFWLMRLLAFHLWYIDSVCTKWIEHIYWILLWSPHELCRAARTITQLSIHGIRLQQREPKSQSIFSFCQFSSAIFSFSLFSLLHFRLKTNFTNCLLDRKIWLFVVIREEFSEKKHPLFWALLKLPSPHSLGSIGDKWHF